MQRLILFALIFTSIINSYNTRNDLVEKSDVDDSFVAPYSQTEKVDAQEENDLNSKDGEVEIRIIEESINKKGLEYEIINNTNYLYYIDTGYTICRVVDGNEEELYKAPPRVNEESDPIEKNGKEKLSIDWSKVLGDLEAGQYILKLRKQTSYSPRNYEVIDINFSIE